MPNLELPKSFDEFVDARKAGFIHVKDYVENGGHLVGNLLFLHSAGAVRCGRRMCDWSVRNQQ